jgi:hypothetical protein
VEIIAGDSGDISTMTVLAAGIVLFVAGIWYMFLK